MIYFVRHGQTEANVKHIYTGEVNVPLTAVGVTQAEAAAEKLKGVRIDRIFCSPLLRAKQTMQAIAKFHPDAPIVFDERLKERGDGEMEGKPIGAEDDLRWNLHAPHREAYGESIQDAFARVKAFYTEILSKYSTENVLVVAHCGIGRLSKCFFDGFPADGDLTKIKIHNADAIILQA